jgi:hypothetical protein
MPKKRYSYHPACLAFPVMQEAELQQLADDIKLRGLLTPIVRHRGKILDGRNRLAACEIAGVEPRFVEWEGEGSPTEWVIATNLIRRQLTASQRAVVAVDLLPVLEKEAKERQRRSRGRGKKGGKELPSNSTKGKASQVAARIAKTNRQYVQDVKKIRQTAPEVVEKIRVGELTVPEGKRLAALPAPVRTVVLEKVSVEGSGKLDGLIEAAQGESQREAGRRPLTAGWEGEPEEVSEPEEPSEEPGEEVDYVVTVRVKLKITPEEFEDWSRTGQARWEVRNGRKKLLANIRIEEIERA